MKKASFSILLFSIFLSVVFVSCKDDDSDNPEVEYDYLVSCELQKTASQAGINTVIDLAATQYPDVTDIKDYVVSGVKKYKIVYKTTFQGESVNASGVVSIPDAEGSYPVLSYQNWTNTLHSDAPSVDESDQLYLVLEMMASTGFVFVLPDYLGFGEADDMFHPYLHKESTVQSVVDMLKAVREFIDSQDGIELDGNLYINGYSQGGWSTMQLQKELEGNSAGYTLKASACGAGPYDLKALNSYILSCDTYAQPYYVAYIYSSFLNLGLETDISKVFQEPYASRIPTMYDGTQSGTELNSQLTTTVANLFTSEYIDGWATSSDFSALVDMMEENSVGDFVPETPTMLLHGNSDSNIPVSISKSYYDKFVAGGASNIKYVELAGGHGDVAASAVLTSLLWFLELRDAN